MIASLANVVAGLGLFFAGIWFLSENLKRATSRRFRQGVIAWTQRPAMGFCVGAVAGGLTQSMSVTVFILVGLLRAGLIGVRNALPVIAGANLGLTALVFVATLETELVMLYVIGIVGFIIGLDPGERFRPLLGALFGLSMLFLGIDLIQTGAVPLLEHEWAEGVLTWASHSYVTGLLAGVILTCISQSSAAVTILALALADAGVFGVEQTIMIIYGTNIGSSVITAALSWNLTGRSRQIAMFQVAFNLVGGVIMVPLFYLEVLGGVPLVERFVAWLTPAVDLQLAWVYLLFNIAAALPLLLALGPASRLLERAFPPSEVEDLSTPRYIHDAALGDPETAIDLALREQRRAFECLGGYLDGLGPDAAGGEGALAERHAAYEMLSSRVMEFLDELGRKVPSYVSYDRINDLLGQQRLLGSLEATLFELAGALRSIERTSELRPLAARVVESLEGAMRQSREAAQAGGAARRAEVALDDGTSEALQGLRAALISHNTELEPAERLLLFQIAHLSERFCWLLSHLRLGGVPRREGA